ITEILRKDQTEIERLTEAVQKAIETRQQELLRALDVQMKSAQQAGDLDALLELRSEVGRVKQGILLGEPVNQPTDAEGRRSFALLRQARDAYNTAATNAKKEFDSKLTQLNERTAGELHQLMRDLTRQGEIDAAIAARDEVNRIRTRTPSQVAASRKPAEGLPVSEHELKPAELLQTLLKTQWRRTYLATGAQETISFERGVTQRGQRWDVLPDGTVALTLGNQVEIWTFNRNLNEAKGYVRGSDRISFTALRQ
ncbi:MAG: hypothetical protein SNJ84_06415, partial [Verrucomicrobiia bacterium]